MGELVFRLRFRKPRFAFEEIELMCEFHLRSSEMCTPKYLICGTEERV